jgi:hypothetical protein
MDTNLLAVYYVIFDLPIVQLDHAIGDIEIVVVVTDDQHKLAAIAEFGQQLPVENILEHRVLAGGPLVEDVNWAILQERNEQR